MRALDLFSGIGGFSLGLERAGMETVAFCEIDPFCQKVLKKHWPGVKIYDDITNSQFTEDVGMVTAGFPCQDESSIGQCAGITGANTGLFWYILRAVLMVGFPKLLLENVAALLRGTMGIVLGALASFGYDAEWHCIPASYVGAWHKRDRIWILAHPGCKQYGEGKPEKPILWQQHLSIKPARVFAQWPGRSNLPQPTLCRGGNGVSKRLDGLGNAVVPQIPEIIGKAIMEQTE